MAELKIRIEADTSKVQDLARQLGNVQKDAEALGGTLRAINKAAEGKELYFATTKARDGFVSLLNEANKLEKSLSDPSMSGKENFKQLSDRLTDVKEKLVDMASSASMAGRVVSANFAGEVSKATRAVEQMEQRMAVAKRNIDNIKTQMGNRAAAVSASGGNIKTDAVYQGLSSDLGRQNTALSGLEAGLSAATSRVNEMRDAQRVFGTSTVKVSDDTNVFLEKLNQLPIVGQATTGVFSQMANAMGNVQMALLGGLGFQQLGARIFSTRSMMQNLEIAFETMLQSGEKASMLMGQLTETAAKTPFGMMDVTNGAKQLLAYGTAAEDVNGILVKLGDISAGLGLPLGDLVYLYGTTMAQGRMFTQDLRQFMGRGIPMAEEIGKILVAQGKATKGTQAEVQDAVTKGKVSADMVKQAIENMTSAGSRFGGLMERQSSTLEGQWSNIEDTVDMMFNDMGKSTEGMFNSALSAITQILDNWQSIVKVIGSAIAAVGLYKAGLAAASLIERNEARNEHEALTGSIDERIRELKEREGKANDTVGYNVADDKKKKAQRDLGKLVADSNITEEQFNLKMSEAKANGIINDELERELRLKREILMEQEKITAQAEQEASRVPKPKQTSSMSDLDKANKEVADTSKAISDVDAEIKRLEEERKKIEETLSNPVKVRELAKVDYDNAQKDYSTATANKAAAEREYNRYNGRQGDIELNKQMSVVSNLGENSPQYQAELAKLEEMKAKREQTKIAFQQACEAETASLQRVKEAQEALNEATKNAPESPRPSTYSDLTVEQAQGKLDDIDTKIARQKAVVAEKQKVTTYENDDEYQAELSKLKELQQQRQVALDEFLEACNQEQSALQGVIDKQQELNDKTTGGDNATSTQQSAQAAGQGETANMADTLNGAAEARRELTEAQKEGKEADEAVASVQEGLSDIAQEAGDATEAIVTAKESETSATETNTIATEADTDAEGLGGKQKKLVQIQSAQKAAQQQKEALATKLNTVQTQADTLAQEKDAAAKQRNGLASAFLGAKNALAGRLSAVGAVGQRIFNAAINECRVALNNLKVALLSNPITAIVTVLTTAGTMLYQFWDNLFGSEDEAENSTREYTNAAEEAASKTGQLYAQMAAAKQGTKSHKDAMAELVKTCEEYGIKLDEAIMKGTDEAAKAMELEKVHRALTEALKEEAIQQEYLNSLKNADADSDDASKENRKNFNESRDEDHFSKEEWSGVLMQVTDEDIQRLAQLERTMANLRENGLRYSSEYEKAYKEYREAYAEMIGGVQTYVRTLMDSKGKLGDYGSAMVSLHGSLRKYVSAEQERVNAQHESYEASERAREASEKAANATNGMTTAQANAAKAIRYSKMKTDELSTAATNLIKSMSGKVIGIGVEFKTWMENINVPKWMLDKSSKDLSKDLRGWMNVLNTMGDADSINVKGKGKMSKKEVLGEIEEVRQAMTQKKAEEDKAAADAEATKKEREKKAKAAAKKAAQEAEKAKAAAKKAQEKSAKDLLSLQQRNDKDSVSLMKNGTEKKLAQIKFSYEKQKAEIDKQEKEFKANNKKAKTKTNADGLTTEQSEALSTARENADKLYEQDTAKVRLEATKAELEAMRGYIKEYGTYQQQKLAIAQEYADKIKEVNASAEYSAEEKQWRVRSLEKERDSAVAGVDSNRLAMSIDWGQTFEGVGNVLTEVARETLAKIEAYMKTAEFNKLTPEQKKVYSDTKAKIQQETGAGQSTSAFNFSIWGKIADDTRSYQQSVRLAQSTEEAHTRAVETLRQKQEELAQATDDATKAEKEKEVQAAQQDVDITGATQGAAAQTMANARQQLTSDTTAAANGLKNFTNAINEMSNGTLYGFANGITKLITSLSGGSESVGKALDGLGSKAGGIVGAILQIIDALGDDPSQFIGDLLEKITDAIDGILDQLASGELIQVIIDGITKLIGTIVEHMLGDPLTAMGIDFGGDSDKTLHEDLERLAKTNEALEAAMENLKDELDDSSIATAPSQYKLLQENITQREKNTRESMQRSGDASSKGFLGFGSKHSSYYKVNEKVSASDWAAVSKAAGVSVRNAQEFFNLTSEQMYNVATYAAEAYAHIKEYADDGKEDAAKYMDTYIAYYKERKELEEQYYDKLTGISFDSMVDDFTSSLQNMDSDAADFADNVESYLSDAILNAMVSNKYKSKLEELYKDIGKAVEDGTIEDEGVAEGFKQRYAAISKEAIDERDLYRKLGIIGDADTVDTQSTTVNTTMSITEDTAKALEGRMTAIQYSNEQIRNTLTTASGSLEVLAAQIAAQTEVSKSERSIADETRTILAQMQMSLKSIDERQDGWEKPMKDMFAQIKEIRDNTKRL